MPGRRAFSSARHAGPGAKRDGQHRHNRQYHIQREPGRRPACRQHPDRGDLHPRHQRQPGVRHHRRRRHLVARRAGHQYQRHHHRNLVWPERLQRHALASPSPRPSLRSAAVVIEYSGVLTAAAGPDGELHRQQHRRGHRHHRHHHPGQRIVDRRHRHRGWTQHVECSLCNAFTRRCCPRNRAPQAPTPRSMPWKGS